MTGVAELLLLGLLLLGLLQQGLQVPLQHLVQQLVHMLRGQVLLNVCECGRGEEGMTAARACP